MQNKPDSITALWTAWAKQGVTRETILAVDHFFYTKSEARARLLATRLEALGMTVQVASRRTLWIFTGWVVQAQRRSCEREMEELATGIGVLYDGCGAEMP